jgi:hypothetical protein
MVRLSEMAGPPINLAEKILLARRRLHEEQPVFAARFKVKKLTVGDWERGKIQPNPDHLVMLKQIFKEVLPDLDDEQFESVTYQLFLPFDEPLKMDFRISPHTEDRVGFAVQVKRKAG